MDCATLSNERTWAMNNWRAPQAWRIIAEWADEIFGLEGHTHRGVIHNKFEVGEAVDKLSVKWVLAKMKYMNWCVNGWGVTHTHAGGPCYCLQRTAFLPNGCVHYPVHDYAMAASSQGGHLRPTLPSTYCPECTTCMRCNKYLASK